MADPTRGFSSKLHPPFHMSLSCGLSCKSLSVLSGGIMIPDSSSLVDSPGDSRLNSRAGRSLLLVGGALLSGLPTRAGAIKINVHLFFWTPQPTVPSWLAHTDQRDHNRPMCFCDGKSSPSTTYKRFSHLPNSSVHPVYELHPLSPPHHV